MTKTNERLIDAVLNRITATYQLPNGQRIQGNAISQVSSDLRDMGWKGVSNLNDLESTLEELGFQIVKAQFVGNGRLNAPARVVTL